MTILDKRVRIKNPHSDPEKDINREITLIANSGIQFIDFEFDAPLNFEGSDDKKLYPNSVVKGQFVKVENYGNHYARYQLDSSGTRLIIPGTDESVPDGQEGTCSLKMIDSLKLYNGVWFPIPYFSKGLETGPSNWARARIVNKSEFGKWEEGGEYHVTLAFDTRIDDENSALHCAPTSNDINNLFDFRSGIEATKLLNSNPNETASKSFVREWALSIFKEIYPLGLPPKKRESSLQKGMEDGIYECHYLNLLAFLEFYLRPNDIRLKPFDARMASSDDIIDVSLILDIGNSRTCGLIVEDNKSSTSGTASFNSAAPLQLRDLNTPDVVYSGSFNSKIEFQKPNFDFNACSSISNSNSAFIWPSMVRVGPEAIKLSSRVHGNEGETGLMSPKRYLWQIDPSLQHIAWNFNSYYYQIPMQKWDEEKEDVFLGYTVFDKTVQSALYSPISGLMDHTGEPLFASAIGTSNIEAKYTNKATMTFLLVELILQSLSQINSEYYRRTKKDEFKPRRLSSLVLTTPPSMPELERAVFRSCAYEAVGLVWKAMGYDKTPVTEFKFNSKKEEMFPAAPKVILEWNETLASQFVYLYNETQEVFGGNCKDFIKFIRRKGTAGRENECYRPKLNNKNPADYVSARIASIDIGGGTTDLVITDYAYPDRIYAREDLEKTGEFREPNDQQSSVEVREVLKEGFKIAGDDLVKQLIREEILKQLGMREMSKIVGSSSDADATNRKKRVLTVEQIFVKIAYRLLDRLEALDRLSPDVIDVTTEGTVADFITGNDYCAAVDGQKSENRRVSVESVVDDEVLTYIEERLPGFNILKKTLKFDIFSINQDIERGRYSILGVIDTLNALVNVYECDVLLLTGRPSKIPGIRHLIERKSILSPRRIISLHKYCCSGWYPAFLADHNGIITDPKSAVVVGALIGFTKMCNQSMLTNFRLNTRLMPTSSSMRYLGVIDNNCKIKNTGIYYKFDTDAELRIQKNEEALEQARQSGLGQEEIRTKELEFEYSKKNLLTGDSAGLMKIGMDDSLKTVDGKQYKETVLEVDLGYRQFADENLQSSMIFRIEVLKNIADLEDVKKLSLIRFPSSSDTEVNASGEVVDGLFSPEAEKKLEETFFSRLVLRSGDKYVKQAKEVYAAARSEIELMRNNSGSGTLVSEVSARIEQEAIAFATRSRDEAIQSKGFVGKLFSGSSQKKGEEIYNQAYAQYRQEHQQEIFDAQDQEQADAEGEVLRRKKRVIFEFSRILKAFKDEFTKACQEELDIVTQAINDKHPFRLKLTTSEKEESIRKNHPIYNCIKFVNEEEQSDDVFLIAIEEAEDIDSFDPISVSDAHKYLTLRLKTITGDSDAYWNHSGILTK